jgi:hypothetical protein
MSIALLGYIAVCLAFFLFCSELRKTRQINKAEHHMAAKMKIALSIQKLESLRDRLLQLKVVAIKAGFQEMEMFYEIEHEMNIVALKLDRIERQIVAQGLQQPSGKGRLEYMLKLVDMTIALG